MVTKRRVTVNLDDEEYEALTLLSKTADRPLSYLGRLAVRRLVAEELEHQVVVLDSESPAQSSLAE